MDILLLQLIYLKIKDDVCYCKTVFQIANFLKTFKNDLVCNLIFHI